MQCGVKKRLQNAHLDVPCTVRGRLAQQRIQPVVAKCGMSQTYATLSTPTEIAALHMSQLMAG